MNKLRLISLIFYGLLLSLVLPLQAATPSCDDVFSGGVASSSVSGYLNMQNSAQLRNLTNNPNVAFASGTATSATSCVSQACNITGSSASSITFPTFTASSGGSSPSTGGNVVIGQTNGWKSNDFNYASGYSNASFTFKKANSAYRFQSLSLSNDATIAFKPGDYYFGSLTLSSNATATVDTSSGTGSVRIHVSGNLSIYNSASINNGGTSSDLVIYASGSSSTMALSTSANLTGVVFSAGAITVHNDAYIKGYVSTKDLTLTSNAYIDVNGDLTSASITDVCTPSTAPQCPVSSDVGDVIINEINKDEDWIELYVTNGSNLSLANWELDGDGNGSSTDVDYTCLSSDGCANQTYNTGDFIVIAKSLSGSILSATQGSSPVLVQGQNLFIDADLALHNNTQEVILFDNSGDMVHYLRYENGSYSATWQSCEDENPNNVTITDPPGGGNSGVCTRPDGSSNTSTWDQDCGDTPGSTNDGASSSLDHYEIILSTTSSSVCSNQTVTARACENADCSTFYTDAAVSGTLYKTVDSVRTNLDSNDFTGSKSVTVNETAISTVLYGLDGVSPTATVTCKDASNNVLANCQIEFTGTSAFSWQNITTTSCTETSATLEAFVYDSGNNSCNEITGDTNVDFSFSYAAPNTNTSASQLTLGNGSSSATINTAGTTRLSINLGTDNNVRLTYADAGQLSVVASDPNSSISSATTTMTAVPSYVAVTSVTDNDGDGNFIAAEPFTINIGGFCSGGTATPNYQPGSLDFTVALVTGSENANFKVANGTSIAVTSSSTLHLLGLTSTSFTVAEYDEYGSFSLALSDSNYYGSAINVSSAVTLGTFIASYLTLNQTGLDNVAFEYHDLTFNYIGKQFGYSGADAENNDFSSAVAPQVRVTAYNADDGLMSNYAPTSINTATLTLADSAISGFSGSTSGGSLAQETSGGSPVAGSYLYTLNNTDNFSYTKTTTLMTPTTSNIQMTFAAGDFTDSDGRSNQSSYTLNATNIEQRYARFYAQDAADTIGGAADIRAQIQHWNGTQWQTTTDDDASILPLDAFDATPAKSADSDPFTVTVTASNGDTSLVTATGRFGNSDPVSVGQFNIEFDHADTALSSGSLILQWDASSLPSWLFFAWDGNSLSVPPATRVAFGNRRGNERIISWRESN
ncbi:hypothetical protein C2869_21455 [Saccharobesus litoralis]|uniref:DUF6701 domain-containing protein n=1 Tax=Saccharobesus litoralis TaxID=2172099 RepID=A0A2S0VX52_9ALTE|nr:DUF6701 domain-containing protein [Saccharobesus litoralis]AWB68807.1 hypothetical protein C2869_21455 [Saccharobesus litoralis]